MRKDFKLLASTILLFFAGFTQSALAQKTSYSSTSFYAREYIYQGDTLPYRVLFPEGYDAPGIEPFPLLIFLHGEDQRGKDNVLQLKYVSSIFKDESIRDYNPAVVLFPQCPENDVWALYDVLNDGSVMVRENPKQTKVSESLQKLITHYSNKSYIDKSRIYIVGISMGAFGALDLVARNPKMFASVVSISGSIEPERFKKLKKMPLRIYHGTDDPIVPVSLSRDLYAVMKDEGSKVIEFIEYPGIQHDAWTTALSSSDFLEWIFEYSLSK